MKKLVLSIVVLSLTTSSFAQNRLNVRQQKTITIPSGETKFSERTSKMNTVLPVRKGQTPHNMTVAVTDIGNSPNHLTVAFSAKTALFAQPEINTVSMVFRNDPSVANAAGSSGYYNFALSTDGGNTWPVTNAYPLLPARPAPVKAK